MTDIPTRIELPPALYPLIRAIDNGTPQLRSRTEWFGEMMDFAQTRPVGEFASLQRCLDRLATMVSNSREKDETGIYRDSAPYSFGWSASGMVGGCIYHGPHDNGGDGGAPTFAVNLSSVDGWSIHT